MICNLTDLAFCCCLLTEPEFIDLTEDDSAVNVPQVGAQDNDEGTDEVGDDEVRNNEVGAGRDEVGDDVGGDDVGDDDEGGNDEIFRNKSMETLNLNLLQNI